MTWWHRLWRRTELEDQLERELRFHLDQHTANLVAQGYPPHEARRQAMIAFGGKEQVKEECRDARGTRWVHDVMQDFRYAVRRLRSNPGFAAVTVFTLALGIGGSAAIFSAVNPILFEPLPYPHAERVAMIWDSNVDGSRIDVAFGTYRELMARTRSFDAIAVMKPWQPTIMGDAEPQRLDGQRVGAGYFRALGVSPMLGRDFEESEDQSNGPNVVVISNGLWQRRFNSDTGIIGGKIKLNGYSFTVIGVMPREFENVLAPSSELWSPLQYDIALPPDGREWGHHLRMVARLAPGVETDQARREVNSIARSPQPEFSRVPWASLEQGFIVNSLQDEVTRAVKPALLAILGAVVLVLVIACVNVTNLLLARVAQRRGEFAMRAALGAGRGRLIRQMLTESLLLAAIGGAFGMLVAEFGVRAFIALSPPELPRTSAITVDSTVFAFGLGITTMIGLLIGLIPALQASQTDLHIGLQKSSRRTAGSHQLTRRVLVVAEVALALVLLVSAGLLLRSMQRLFAVAPGFESSNVLTMQVQTSGPRFNVEGATQRFFNDAREAVREVPGVASAALTSQLPLSGDVEKYGVEFESIPNDTTEDQSALRYAVSPGYFETMKIPLRGGRLLDGHDVSDQPMAALISESFAKRKFPGGNPIGQRIHIGDTDRPWFTIVGVVGDVKQTSLAVNQADAVYTTIAQWYFPDNPLWLVVRGRGNVSTLTPAIRSAIWGVDKDQPIMRVNTMDQLVNSSASERLFALILFEAFALVALVLAATGIYGVLSGSVSERMREMGVRVALGASRRQILTMVVRQGLTLTGAGVVIGLTGAVAATEALVTLLFGVSRLDPITYLGVIALLVGVAVIACSMPAWRAARVDPSITLRAE